mmetsp:Transcript_16619/g.63205  ORF Transcript_16619/g.63205 Transcript_16619/m.63205 type:complete len:296 (-) Transcript_16619:2806-3693(-)
MRCMSLMRHRATSLRDGRPCRQWRRSWASAYCRLSLSTASIQEETRASSFRSTSSSRCSWDADVRWQLASCRFRSCAERFRSAPPWLEHALWIAAMSAWCCWRSSCKAWWAHSSRSPWRITGEPGFGGRRSGDCCAPKRRTSELERKTQSGKLGYGDFCAGAPRLPTASTTRLSPPSFETLWKGFMWRKRPSKRIHRHGCGIHSCDTYKRHCKTLSTRSPPCCILSKCTPKAILASLGSTSRTSCRRIRRRLKRRSRPVSTHNGSCKRSIATHDMKSTTERESARYQLRTTRCFP